MSRLDAPVSGVLVFARTSKAAARLTEQFRTRAVEKIYWALVSPAIVPPAGQLTHWLLHDDRHRKVHVVAAQTSASKEARLSYQQLQPIRQGSLLEVQLETGRKHQIRVQLARQGAAVVGDRKYGSQVTFGAGIALHARRLKFTHPTQGTELEFIAPLPKTWHAWNVT
jgi:23S rRNA pseudouridine1911/1915/1917 synthase